MYDDITPRPKNNSGLYPDYSKYYWKEKNPYWFSEWREYDG